MIGRAMRKAAALGAAALAAGCGASLAPLRTPVPEAYYDVAQPVGAPGVRIWSDQFDAESRARVEEGQRAALIARWREAGSPPEGLRQDILALSGGGPDGAFAAGLLNGWTEAGGRPDFSVVTGISVGALIAPFAFAGPEHDADLRQIFTEFGTEDVAELQLLAVLRGALGVADTQPLRRQIAQFIDAAFLKRIADKSRRGHLLLVGTTNIDAGRPVLWNMGEIAERGDADLFADVMLASASIPGAFPPVLIDVEAEGQTFTEFHVDGGVTHSVILGPQGAAEALPRVLPFPVSRTIYVIQNNQLAPAYAPVEPRLSAIAARSLSTLIRSQTAADLGNIYSIAEAIGADFRLAFVPPGFDAPSTTSFDTAYMTGLFNRAEEMALAGTPWFEAPPGMIGRRTLQAELERLSGDRAKARDTVPARN